MSGSGINTYKSLKDKYKYKSQHIADKAAEDLYAALFTTEKDGNEVKDILIPNDDNLLSLKDRGRILYVLDYLRIAGVKSDIFTLLTSEDFAEIKKQTTPKARADTLINIVIQRSGKASDMTDILQHAEAMVALDRAEATAKNAEREALKRLSFNQFKRYGAYIRDKINKNTDGDGNIDWSKCYIDVIKYANYASMGLLRRITTRRMVPARFSRRDIPKQTQKTLKALDDRLEELKKKLIESNKDPEIYGEINAIRYISDNLQKAFQYYISKIGPSDTEFEKVMLKSEDLVYGK